MNNHASSSTGSSGDPVVDAYRAGCRTCAVPRGNAREASLLPGMRVLAFSNLREAVDHLSGRQEEDGEGTQRAEGSVPQTGETEYAEESLPQEKAIKNIVFYSLGNYISNQSEPDYTQLELLVTITLVRDNISGAIGLLPPKYEYLWCFKAGEFEKDYTVVPIDYFKNNPKAHKKVRHGQYGRMVKTYEYVKNLNLYKGLSHE